ncbi:hypothetical protein J4444_02925 [Candidatus Woesearchaeota archaeon]|nr:hypothetical protein [Candidatus Woesearchaeota archaeon]
MASAKGEVKLELLNSEIKAISRELTGIAKALDGGRLFHYTQYKRNFNELSNRLATIAREI